MKAQREKPTPEEREKARQARDAMQWLSASIGGWTLPNVENAVRQMMTGNFKEAAKLAKYIYSTSPAVKAVVDKRVASLMGSETIIDAGAEDSVSQYVSQLVKELFEKGVDRDEIKRWVRQFVLLGVSPMHCTWDCIDGWWMPCPESISMETVNYQQHRDEFTVQLRSGTEKIDPGDGNWVFVNDWAYGEVSGLIGSIAVLWWIGQATVRAFLDGNKAHINPKVLLQQVSDLSGMSGDDLNAALDELNATLTEGGVGYVKAGYNVNPLTIGTYNSNAFKDLLEYVDRRITIAALGSNLSTEMGSGGSYAAAVTHDGVERRLTIADADAICAALNSQLMNWMCYINFPTVQCEPPTVWIDVEDRDRQEKRISQLSDVKDLIGEDRWDISVDVDAVLKEFNVPRLKE